jgi:hypothetical protein
MIEFAQPAALWTALSIGLPILAHMAYRRVTEKFYFPSLRFIRPSQIPRAGKRTPSDILLLILRILLFLVLAALLADPYWKRESQSVDEGSMNETVILIDLSPSMAGWDGLIEAKEKSMALLEEIDGSVGLVTTNDLSSKDLNVGQDRNILKSEIESLSHGWSHVNAQLILDRVPKMFSENATTKKLILISDFQKSDWQTAYLDMSKFGISCELFRVGQGPGADQDRGNNLSIMEARAVPAGPNKIRIWSVVRNWDDTAKSADLELVAGGEVRGKNALDIPPLGSVQAQFVVNEGDFANAKVRLSESDDFLLDNERDLWLKAPPAKRFGFWMPSLESDETEEEKSFLQTAISSAGDNGWNRWVLDQDQADNIRLGNDQLNLRCLLILGINKWFNDEQLGEATFSHIESGGSVLATPSEPFSSTVSVLKSAGLLNFNFVRVAGGANRGVKTFRIDALEEGSLLSDVFEGKAARDLYLSAIHQFGILKAGSEAQGFEVPLRDREGRPLAIVRKFESGGRFVFLPFKMSTSWTDLPLRNSFLPLLMELIEGGSGSTEEGWPILEPGDLLQGEQNDFVAKMPGAFRHEDQWLEVVLPSSESTPETLSSAELDDILNSALKEADVVGTISENQEGDSDPLWMWFAFVAVCIFIIEIIWSRPKSPSVLKESIHA